MNCLVIDDLHPIILEELQSLGIEVHYEPTITKEEILQKIGDYEGIIVRSKIKLDKTFFTKATNLKYIARAGSGTDNIDVEEAKRKNVQILNAPEGNRDAVAEHVIGMLLNLLNKIRTADLEVRDWIWKREANRGWELGHKTVGIIGYGNTGRAVSKRIVCFGCKVLAFDIHGIQHPEQGVESSDMDKIFEEADILTLHIPLDGNNYHLVNKAFLERFKKNIWIINAARGEIVNTQDLVEAIETKKIKGAGLDVLENEKFTTYSSEERANFERLTRLPNVILTPHVAGWTHESYLKISEVLAKKIKDFYEKKRAK